MDNQFLFRMVNNKENKDIRYKEIKLSMLNFLKTHFIIMINNLHVLVINKNNNLII